MKGEARWSGKRSDDEEDVGRLAGDVRKRRVERSGDFGRNLPWTDRGCGASKYRPTSQAWRRLVDEKTELDVERGGGGEERERERVPEKRDGSCGRVAGEGKEDNEAVRGN